MKAVKLVLIHQMGNFCHKKKKAAEPKTTIEEKPKEISNSHSTDPTNKDTKNSNATEIKVKAIEEKKYKKPENKYDLDFQDHEINADPKELKKSEEVDEDDGRENTISKEPKRNMKLFIKE